MKEFIYGERQIVSSDGSIVVVHRVRKQELVRCKDCKHKHFLNEETGRIVCKLGRGANAPDWFCGDGERNKGR